jgi:hypothetical protein
MKIYRTLATVSIAAWAAAIITPRALAESPAGEIAMDSVSAPVEANPHKALCATLGLRVGGTYEFMLSGNNEIHYWQIRSLGANGWILTKDSRHPATWVNLSQIIAITPLNVRPGEERPKKPNRER